MLTRRRLKIAAVAAFGAAVVPLAAIAAGDAAAAEQADDAFVGQVSYMGIGFTSRQTVIDAGHDICQALSSGQTAVSASQNFARRTKLTPTQATGFVAAAVHAYCARFTDQLSAS